MNQEIGIGVFVQDYIEGDLRDFEVKTYCSCGHKETAIYPSAYYAPRKHQCNQCGNKIFYHIGRGGLSIEQEHKILLPSVFDIKSDSKSLDFKVSNISAVFNSREESLTIIKKNLVRHVKYNLIEKELKVYRNGELEYDRKSSSNSMSSFNRINNYLGKISVDLFVDILEVPNPFFYKYYSKINRKGDKDRKIFDTLLHTFVGYRANEVNILSNSGLLFKDDVKLTDIEVKNKPYEILQIDKSWIKKILKNKYVLTNNKISTLRYLSEKVDKVNQGALDPFMEYLSEKEDGRWWYYEGAINKYMTLLRRYHYNPKQLGEYIFNTLPMTQAISDPRDGIDLLLDYVTFSEELNLNKYKRFPPSLKLAHDLVASIHQANKITIDENKFSFVVNQDDYQMLIFSSREYVVITPESKDDVINEGANLNHCVGSYVNKIANGTSKILFMRKDRESSLVTLEIKDDALVQARGRFNRSLTAEESKFIDKYCKEKKIARKV